MAQSNFNYIYKTIPNLYFKTYEEILDEAYYQGLSEEETESYIDLEYDHYKILDTYDIKELEQLINHFNGIIQSKGWRLYDSRRECDQIEGEMLKNFKIFIEPGNYEGAQLAVSSDYEYLNKTNKKLIKDCLVRIAKKFNLWAYDLAYRFSNGETGFTKIREY